MRIRIWEERGDLIGLSILQLEDWDSRQRMVFRKDDAKLILKDQLIFQTVGIGAKP